MVAAFLAVEMGSLLVGESASPDLRRKLLVALESPETVDRVINSRTMHLGPDEVLVAAKLAVGETDSAAEVIAAINEAEQAARDCAARAAHGHLPRARRRHGAGYRQRRRSGRHGRPT